MKKIAHLSLAALAVAIAQSAEVIRFKSNAETALIQAFDPAANSFTQIDVSRHVTMQNGTKTVTTNLIVQSNSCEGSVCSGFNGNGTIPNSDFDGGARSATLHTNTAGNPGFTLIGFTRNLEIGEETTFPLEGGIIAADWEATDLFSVESNGTSVRRQPGLTVKSKGQFSLSSAEAAGSVLGAPLATPNSGLIGVNMNRETTIIRE